MIDNTGMKINVKCTKIFTRKLHSFYFAIGLTSESTGVENFRVKKFPQPPTLPAVCYLLLSLCQEQFTLIVDLLLSAFVSQSFSSSRSLKSSNTDPKRTKLIPTSVKSNFLKLLPHR